jgi:hypothetical protein
MSDPGLRDYARSIHILGKGWDMAHALPLL